MSSWLPAVLRRGASQSHSGQLQLAARLPRVSVPKPYPHRAAHDHYVGARSDPTWHGRGARLPPQSIGLAAPKRYFSGFAAPNILDDYCEALLTGAHRADARAAMQKHDLAQAFAAIREALTYNNFIVTRGLQEYVRVFGSEFETAVAALRSNDHMCDVGAGEAHFFRDFVAQRTQQGEHLPRMTALGVVKPDCPTMHRFFAQNPTARYMTGYFEDIDVSTVGQAKMVTDVYGAASYTTRLSDVLQRSIDLLMPNGILWIAGEFPIATVYHPIHDTSLPLFAWLARCDGINVSTCFSGGIIYAARIEKTEENVVIPPLLVRSYKAGKPPRRVFDVVE